MIIFFVLIYDGGWCNMKIWFIKGNVKMVNNYRSFVLPLNRKTRHVQRVLFWPVVQQEPNNK